jgi:predicted GTPase
MVINMKSQTAAPSMIVVMGVTGAGKSYFINQLAGKDVVQEGADLDSCQCNALLNRSIADLV